MKHKIKKWLSLWLVAVLFVTAIPVRGICTEVNALQEMAESCLDQELTETDQTDSDGEDGTDSVQIVTEDLTETVNDTEAATEISSENTTETTTETGISEQTTEDTTEKMTGASMPRVLAGMRRAASLSDDKAPLGLILASGAWAQGHYRWYVNLGDNSRHYIFCLEKGKVMKSNTFRPKKYSGTWGSAQNTFRIATAMDYFKKQGGWGSESGYETAQNVIWNQGVDDESKALLQHIEYLWKVTEKNEGRKSGSGSYSGKLTPIKKTDVKDNASRKKVKVAAKKVPLAGTDKYNVKATVKLGGAAWKYFAGGNGYGSLEVQGCYQADGSKLSDSVAKASIDSKGSLTVQTQITHNNQEIATNEKNAVMVIVKVNPKYEGATQIDYLATSNSGNQTLSYDARFSSPAYFAIKVYATPSEAAPTGILVNKQDEFGQAVDGAQFGLYKTDEPDMSLKRIPVEEGEYTEIDKTGSYMLVEERAPEGLSLYTNSRGDHVVAYFEVKSRLAGAVKQLYIVPTLTFENVTAVSSKEAMAYTYTVDDAYEQGDAYIHKIANAFVAFKNGRFIYQKRDLEHVSFELYAATDIYAQDIRLFEADQRITNELLSDSIWNKAGKHKAYIEQKTDANGYIRYHNLPCGRYYVIEKVTDSNKAYWVSGERIYFDIEDRGDDNPKQIHEGEGYWNNPVKAKCMVIKEDTEGKPLKGAEFTLYAHIGNTNFFGEPLFTKEQTQPVVISRINGYKRISEEEWIPIATMESNEDGEAYFDMDMPYGKYLVAETQPPKDEKTGKRYEFAKETYAFEHIPDDMENFASGALFQHVFTDNKVGNFILIRKTGEQLSKADTVKTEYGEYKKLVYEPFAASKITFEIRNLAGELVEELTTNEYGEAKSKDLAPGTYYVKEIRNGGSMKLDGKVRKVVVKEDMESSVQVQEVDFVNHPLATKFRIHKRAEQAERKNAEIVSGVSDAESLYTYHNVPIAGVVFGMYAREDIRNVDGTVIVKADSCVGYAVTDHNGEAVVTEPLVTGNYYYKECKTADDSYRQDDEKYPFRIELKGEELEQDLNKDKPIVNEKYRGSILVIKTDSVTKKPLQDVEFVLYDGNKEKLGSFVTDKEGKITIRNLPFGCYYLQETKTLEKYELNSDMQEIVLKKGYQNAELNITNDRKKESLPEEDQVENKKQNKISGQARTGDVPIQYTCIAMVTAILLLLVLLKRKEIVQLMKKAGKMLGLLSFMVLCMMPNKPAQAIGLQNESINALETSVKIDGRLESARVEFEKENKRFRMKIYCDDMQYVSNQYYIVTRQERDRKGADTTEYVLERIDRDNGNKAETLSFTLSKSDQRESFTVPKEIEVTGQIDYHIDGISAQRERLSLAEKGEISRIEYNENMNLIINEDSHVDEIEWHTELGGQGMLNSLKAFHIVCYKRGVSGRIYSQLSAVYKKDDIDAVKNAFCNNVKVRYGSELAKALTFQCHVVNENNDIELMEMEPGYVTGQFVYELNGGKFENDSYQKEYIRGKDSFAGIPVRKDYAFAGWYADGELSEDSCLKQDADGRYYITSEQAQADRYTLYAKWIYSVYVERNGMTFHVGPTGEAEVIANANALEADIPDKIEYGGITYPVVRIAAKAFENATIRKVSIAASVKKMDASAFLHCDNLAEVYINGMELTLGANFPKNITLTAYEESQAYKKYGEEGYTGEKNAYASKITYVLNGGENAVENPEKYCWKSYLLLRPAIRTGYRFDGWYKDSAFQKASYVESIQKDQYTDIVLYAKFTPLKSNALPEELIVGADPEVKQDTGGATQSDPDKERQSSITRPKLEKIKIKVRKSKKVTLSMKAKMAEGYCIEYATNKKLKNRKTVYISKNTHTFTKWKKKKTYYLRLRAYNYDEKGKRVFGAFSKIYKVKLK